MLHRIFTLSTFCCVAFTVCSDALAAPMTLSNSTQVLIPGIGTSGPGSPYPSSITVSGVVGNVVDVNVSLSGVSHDFPDDIHLVLRGPTGASLYLMANAGGGIPFGITNVDLTFDDEAAVTLPNEAQITSGSYRVSQFGTALSAGTLSPAPAPAFGGTLSLFDGLNPNGQWSLYAYDDGFDDVGSIAGGWSITFDVQQVQQDPASEVPEPASLVVWSLLAAGVAAWRRRRLGAV